MNALLVEDEPAIRHILQTMLARSGFTVEPQANGRAALEALSTKRYDLLVTDLTMPVLGGREVVAWSRDHAPETIVMVVTGFIDCAEAQGLEEAGVYVLRKPFKVGAVRDLLEGAIADRIRAR